MRTIKTTHLQNLRYILSLLISYLIMHAYIHINNYIMWVKFAQLCPTLCDPMDYTVHGILQARIPEWVAFPFSRGSSRPRNQIQVSRIAGGFFTSWATREGPYDLYHVLNPKQQARNSKNRSYSESKYWEKQYDAETKSLLEEASK